MKSEYLLSSTPAVTRRLSWININVPGIEGNHPGTEWSTPSPSPPSSNSGKSTTAKKWFGDQVQKMWRKKTLERRLPITSWLPKYTFSKFFADMIAGFTVGLTILPQGLAYASVAGLQPQYGLYSGFVGCFVYILFGSRKEINIGPTAVLAIVTFGYIHDKVQPVDYAIFLCFFTGVVTLLLGLFQFGFIINFISKPVSSAFNSAAALTIASTQAPALLGLHFKANGVLQTWMQVYDHMYEIRLWDVVASVVFIVTILILRKLNDVATWCEERGEKHRIYGVIGLLLWFLSTARNALVVILGGAVAYGIMQYTTSPPFALSGHIIAGLPTVRPPPFSVTDGNTTIPFTKMFSEMNSAFIVLPLLAMMEHISIAKACAGAKPVDAMQEMISIGLTNIVSSFFHSMPVTGSFSRSTVNHASGVQTPLGGLLTGTLVILSLQFLTPCFYYIPQPALAAVIVCAVIFMVEVDAIIPIWVTKKMDLIPAAATFIVSLLFGLEYGILTGLGISVLFLLYYAARPGITTSIQKTAEGLDTVHVFLDRSMVFPSVTYIRSVISKAGIKKGNGKIPVVVDCHHIQFVDSTAAQGIKDLLVDYKGRNQLLVFWQLKPSLRRILSAIQCKDILHCENDNELDYILSEKNTTLATVSSLYGDSGMSLACSDSSEISVPL